MQPKFFLFYGARSTYFRLKKVIEAFRQKEIMLIEEHFPVQNIEDAGLVFSKTYRICKESKPLAGIICADRYETLAAAMGITYAGIPLIHLQGGDVSGTLDDRIRHAVTKLSDYHFPYSEDSAFRLLWMKEDRDRIFYYGDPSKEYALELASTPIKNDFSYLISMLHPDLYYPIGQVELKNYFEALKMYSKKTKIAVYHFWPNSDPGSELIIDFIKKDEGLSNHKILINKCPEEFIPLLKYCKFIIGNSSTGIREAGILRVKAINVGHRQEGRTTFSNVLQASFNEEDLLECMQKEVNLKYEMEDDAKGSGERIVNKILSL